MFQRIFVLLLIVCCLMACERQMVDPVMHGSTPLSLPAVDDITATVGDPDIVLTTPTASGGTSPYTYEIDFGDGVGFFSVGSAIAFSTTIAETLTMTYRVTDADGDQATTSFTITINEA